MNWKSFIAGAVVGGLIAGVAISAPPALIRSAMASKGKSFLGTGLVLNDAVVKYQKEHGSCPPTAADVARLAGLKDATECDYFSDGRTYILIYPSLASKFRGWGPYIFTDGALRSWPSSMPDEIVNDVLQRRSHAAPN